MSRTLLVADAIVALINDPGRTWNGDITAERRYRPRYTQAQIVTTAKLAVAINTRVREAQTRRNGPTSRIMTIDLGFFKLIDGTQAARELAIDVMVNLVEEIEDFFMKYDFTVGGIDCIVRSASTVPLYDRELIDEKHTFGSVMTLEVFESS